MSDLFKARMEARGGSLASSMRKRAYAADQKVFRNTTGYRDAKLYDCCMNLLEEHVDIVFSYSQNYTINKDQVEWLVRFRPDFFPEKVYKQDDGVERMGFYLEFSDEKTGTMEKWLILGRNDKDMYVRYNVLKCNWTFRWVTGGVIYSCLGCVRDRNSYSSGIWSDGFVTSVEDQTMFIVPTNPDTLTLNYGIRFMLTDNPIHPTAYEISKMTTVTPKGISKIVLTQSHVNPEKDNYDLKICDYYTAVHPIPEEHLPRRAEITMSGTDPTLTIGGRARLLTAELIKSDKDREGTLSWSFLFRGEEKTAEELLEQFKFKEENNTLLIAAKDDDSLIGEVLTVVATFSFENPIALKAFKELEVIR